MFPVGRDSSCYCSTTSANVTDLCWSYTRSFSLVLCLADEELWWWLASHCDTSDTFIVFCFFFFFTSGTQAAAFGITLGSVFCVICHDHSSRTVPSCLPLKKSLISIQWITDGEGSLNWGFLSIIISESYFMIKSEFFSSGQELHVFLREYYKNRLLYPKYQWRSSRLLLSFSWDAAP